jgi:serine/threonine-protein kinase
VLATGSRFGPFEIVGLIGAGGMGEVYRARDARLQRDVALKILPDIFASDPERLARFEREAQVLASLSHPSIAAIYGFEQSDGVRALVLELVEGATLADRLAAGPLPIDDALNAAAQIAEALQFAHEQGVIHRDLKPANIKITPDGVVKVLDFGLAKLAQPATAQGSPPRGHYGPRDSPERAHDGRDDRTVGRQPDLTMSPTITSPAAMTGVGMILGTAAYMSPEQAKGRDADKRSDIWAFGCVFYEMVTGQRAFEGEDIGDTLASVIKGDVDWSRLPATLPDPCRTVIQRCLVKDRRKRIADISVAHFLLSEPAASALPPTTVAPDDTRQKSVWRWLFPVLCTIVVTAAATAALMWRPSTEPAHPVMRFSISAPEGTAFTSGQPLAISRDGSQIVYAANLQLYLRSLSEQDSMPIAGTLAASTMRFPVFSPDGRSVAFWSQADRTLRRIPVTGGVSVPLCDYQFPLGISWDGDWVYFGHPGGVSRVSANGGRPEVIVKTNAGEWAATPQMLPGGNALLFTLAKGTADDMWDTADIIVHDVKSGDHKVLVHGGSDARYAPTGHLLYTVGGTVRAVPFDAARLEVTGGPVPVLLGVQRLNIRSFSNVNTGSAYYSFSDTGSLIYAPGPTSLSSQRSLALIGRDGAVTRLRLPAGTYAFPRVSPDGQWLAYGTDDGKNADIWVYQLSGETQPRRVTFGGVNRFPVWSSDGQHVAFQSDREGDLGIWWQRIEGGMAERLTRAQGQGETHVPDSFSRDGRSMSFTVRKDVSSGEVWVLSLPEKKAAIFSQGSRNAVRSAFSPDGSWLAYQSGEDTTAGVLVEPFPRTGTILQVARRSTATPHHPFWSRDGKELFYIPGPNAFASVRVTTHPVFSVSNPETLPRGAFLEGGPEAIRNLDILPDGRFVGVIDAAQSDLGTTAMPRLNVVLNWFEELKRTVPTK